MVSGLGESLVARGKIERIKKKKKKQNKTKNKNLKCFSATKKSILKKIV